MKIVFVGPPGVGKSTAIRTLSDFPPVSTEVPSSDEKRMTTVALDFGEIDLGGDEPVRLYGVPGQERFDFIWPLVSSGAIGILFLIDCTHPAPLAVLDEYLGNFAELASRLPAIVVLTHGDAAPDGLRETHFVKHLDLRGKRLPVVELDLRKKREALYLMHMLLGMIEQSAAGNALSVA